DEVEMLGYLFFVGDSAATPLDYRRNSSSDDWLSLRDRPALDADAIISLAEAAQARYGFRDFKLKGGVFEAEREAEIVTALARRFPEAGIKLDPNGCWRLAQALEIGHSLRDVLSYAEDPVG